MDLQPPIIYLENKDIDEAGNIILPADIPPNIAIILFIQTSWCSHCAKAKPFFQEFARKHNGRVLFTTIQADEQPALEQRIKLIDPSFRGYPDYVLYKHGTRVQKQINPSRDVIALEEFIR